MMSIIHLENSSGNKQSIACVEKANQQVIAIGDKSYPLIGSTSYSLAENVSIYRDFISINEKKIKLSQAASRALYMLFENKNALVTKKQLLEYVWFGRTIVQNNANVVISELRTALLGSPIEIITVRGMGFVLTVKAAS